MASVTYGELLRNKGIRAFLWTQFLGAFNDNVFKFIVSMRRHGRGDRLGRRRRAVAGVGVVFIGAVPAVLGLRRPAGGPLHKRTVLVVDQGARDRGDGARLAALTLAAQSQSACSSCCS